MKNWSADKIAVVGLVTALLISIIAGIWTGEGSELQNTIVGSLLGYLGRVIHERNPNKPKADKKDKEG